MAYINVSDWTTEQVTDWLKGLNAGSNRWLQSMSLYRTSFTNNQINGNRLLNIRPHELEELGIRCIGHQEIILEALEVLKNFHFNLDKENLQYLAMNVATSSNSLFRQLTRCSENKVNTDMLKEITRTISYLKRLIDWIDKPPFYMQKPFDEVRVQMLVIGLEIATCAQREKFTDNPVRQLHQKTEKLAKLADCVIQTISDPMLLQPSTLDLVTLKKRESELGFYILPSVYGVHKITEITYNSPAHNSNKLEEGDEIVQINYQTVVGWNRDRVLYILRESAPDVLLTIRKRPRHTKMYGQIYIKPYRLPSKKRSHPYRWGESLPSPRGDFLNTHDFFPCLKSLPEKHLPSDSELSSSDTEVEPPPKPLLERTNNFYTIKIHRRHSICCDGYSMVKSLNRNETNFQDQRMDDSPSLRDKSVSFGFGLESTGPRPTTHLGINSIKEQPEPEEKPKLKERKLSNTAPTPAPRPRGGELEGVSKVVSFDSSAKLNDHIDSQYSCNVANSVLETFTPIPYADDEGEVKDTPPAIEPRFDKKKPVPPPRPSKKILNALPPIVIPVTEQFEPPGTPTLTQDDKRSKLANVVDLRRTKVEETPPTPTVVTTPDTALELLIQTNSSKNLTLKKKNSLISKRRKAKVNQLAANSDIQGHLYRRTKNRQGASYWAKLYVLLIDTALYGFKTKTSTKATCLIFLPGFTVTKAQEVHSKSFAFKVYHPRKTFYFAAETEEAQKQWIEYINQATMKNKSPANRPDPDHDSRDLFSETDSSEDDISEASFQIATPSPLLSGHHGKKNDSTPTTSRTEGKYHLGFGSLKKSLKNLNSPNESSSDSKFLSLFSSSRSAERKNSIDVPVPTPQFKSYRKMPVNVNLQTGSVTVASDELPPPSPKVINNYEKEEPIFDEVIFGEGKAMSPPLSPPKASFNYMHASNPNLLDFQTFIAQKPNFEYNVGRQREGLGQQAASNWENSQSLTGFVTLKDLMLQKQAEDAKEMYNKRVCLGIEKTDDRSIPNNRKVSVTRLVTKNEEHNIDNEARSKINKIQKRTLPVTPDYAQSFKPDDQDILYTRSREGQKLRDFGYELITGDDRVELKNNLAAANQEQPETASGRKKTNKVAAVPNDTKKRTMNWMGSSVAEKTDKNGSIKKTKNKSGVIEKFDHLVASSEKLFHFRQHSANETESLKVKPTIAKPAVVATNWNLVESPDNDKTASYFTKLTFANRSAKEKKLLGSPRLHRAIFGNRHHHDQENKPIDHEVFLPLNFAKSPETAVLNNGKATNVQTSAEPGAQSLPESASSTSPSDYPNMEYPPTFEAEIYSLSDLSSNLLKRRHQNVEK